MNHKIFVSIMVATLLSTANASAAALSYGYFEGRDRNGRSCQLALLQGLGYEGSDRIGVSTGRNIFAMGPLSKMKVSETEGLLLVTQKMHLDSWHLESSVYRAGYDDLTVSLWIRSKAGTPTEFELSSLRHSSSAAETIFCGGLKSIQEPMTFRRHGI